MSSNRGFSRATVDFNTHIRGGWGGLGQPWVVLPWVFPRVHGLCALQEVCVWNPLGLVLYGRTPGEKLHKADCCFHV